MPDQNVHLADFKKSGHQLRCFMSIYVGRLVMEGEVIAPVIYQNIDVFFNVTSGDYLDVYPGFRVEFYTPTGGYKGRTRVSYGSTVPATSHSVFIRETSLGTVDIQVGDIIRIYRDVRLSDKLVTATEAFLPDGELYTDQNTHPRPIVGSGGAWAGWTRMLPTVMTDYSYPVDPANTGGLTHSWDEDGLSYASGGNTSASPTFTGGAGEYLPAHTAIDADSSKETAQFIPIIIHDKDHPPYKVMIEDLSNEETRGGSVRVRMLQNVLRADVPDGAFVMLWKEEWIAGTRQSFGARAPGRSHILMTGYLRREEGERDGATGAETLTFEVISALARLDELMGYGHVMLNKASPAGWGEIYQLKVVRGLIQVPQVYSNLNESGHDYVINDTVEDFDYPGLFAEQATPIGQMRKLADGIDCRIIEDRRGRFEVQMRPELVAIGARGGLAIALTLDAKSIKKWRYTREHWFTLNRLQCNGFVAGYVNNPVIFSEWPGPSPAEGNQTTTIEGLIAASQAELNERCGRRGAAAKGVFVDEDGVEQTALDLELTLRGVYDVFDFYDELIEVNVTANRRGIDFSDQQYVLVGSSVGFDEKGTAETIIRLRTATHGVSGSTFTPPPTGVSEEPNGTPDIVPQPIITVTPTTGIPLTSTTDTIFGYNDDGYVYRVNNWQSAEQTVSRAAMGVSGTVLDAVTTALAHFGIVVTTSGIYTLGDVSGTITATLKVTLAHTAITACIEASYSTTVDLVVVTIYYGSAGGSVYLYSLNDGSTWSSEITLTAFYDSAGTADVNGLHVSPRNPGTAITSAGTTTAGNNLAGKIYTLSSNFSVATQIASPAGYETLNTTAFGIHVPFDQNGESIVYFGAVTFAGGLNYLKRKNANGSVSDITPSIGGVRMRPWYNRSIHSCPVSRARLLFAMVGPAVNGMFMSSDGGDTMTLLNPGASSVVTMVEVAGNSRDVGFAGGYGGYLAAVDLSRQIVADRSAALLAAYPSAGRFLRIRGG